MIIVTVPDVDNPCSGVRLVRHKGSSFRIQDGCLVISAESRYPTGEDGYATDIVNVHAYAAGTWLEVNNK